MRPQQEPWLDLGFEGLSPILVSVHLDCTVAMQPSPNQ